MEANITQQNRSSTALKSGIWYTISSISVKAVLIITLPLFTRLMSTADFGIAATFTSWYTLFNVICSLNLWYSIGRAKLDFPGELEEFVGSLQLLAFTFTLALGTVSLFFLDRVAELLEMNQILVVILFIYLLAYPAVQLTQAKLKYLYNYKGNILITVFITLSTILFSLALIFVFSSQRYLGKSLGAVVSSVLLAIVIWTRSLRKGYVKVNFIYWKYALIISVPLILNSVSLNILAQADRIFITKYCGSEDTGIYSLAYNYAILINIILNAVNEAWLPWFHDTFNDGLNEPIRKNVKPLVIFGCFFGVGCIAIAPEAMAILGGKAYEGGVWVVPPVTLGIVCSYIFQHYEHIELHLKKTWYISAGTILAAGVNVVLNIIFIPVFGFVAAAYATLFCYLLLMIAHHFISRIILKIKLYDDRFMYLAILVTAVFAAVFMLLYKQSPFWRWILIIGISLGYLVSNRTYIEKILKDKLHFNMKTTG